jgi:hypothetical protein
VTLLLFQNRPTPGPPPPHPIPRGPLPPFDPNSRDPETGAPLPVTTTLNGSIPAFTDPDYLRANLWAVTLDGVPSIPGGASGAAQNRLLTYLLDRYPPAWQDRWLRTYAERGYRHFWLSIPDSRDGTHLSLPQYLDLTKRVLAVGLLPCHFLRSKDYDGTNPAPSLVEPWVDALLTIGGIAWAASAWEASLFNSPEHFHALLTHDALRWPSIRWSVHLQDGYADYGPNGPAHGPIFWRDWCLPLGVRTLLYQMNPHWSAGMMQARGNDVSVRLIQGGLWGLPATVRWIPFETIATDQFTNGLDGDGRIADEDHGDLKGYETLCTPGPLPPSGFGNGCRYPDGRVL